MAQSETIIQPSVLMIRSVMDTIDELCLGLDMVNKPGQALFHRIRVDIKKLRAWIRLIQDKSNTGNLKDIDRYLRDIAKQFSPIRDNEIIPETISWLQEKTKKPDESIALQKIRKHLLYQKSPVSLYDEQFIRINKNIFSELKQKSMTVNMDGIINSGFKATNKKTMHCGKKAYSSKSSLKDLHRLRKWVKYLCYQFEYIQASCPGYCQQQCLLLDKLGKRLGRIHDLDVLRGNLNSLKDTKNCVDAVNSVKKQIDIQIKKIRNQSERLFKEISAHSRDYLMSAY